MSEKINEVVEERQSAVLVDKIKKHKTVFAEICAVAGAMNAQLTTSRPVVGRGRKSVAGIAVIVLVLFCLAAYLVAKPFSIFVRDTLLRVNVRTSVVIVIIVISALIFLATVVVFLTWLWKFYKYADDAVAKEDARKIKEYEVYEQKLYAYYDKILEEIWTESYLRQETEQQEN